MPASKTFTALSTLPEVAIGKCSEILENRLQCWKAADYQITCTDGTTYQKCRRHAQVEFQADIAAGTAPADVVDTQDEQVHVTLTGTTDNASNPVMIQHETTTLPLLKADAQTAAPTATK